MGQDRVFDLSYCSFECSCDYHDPCEVYIGIRDGQDKILCEVFIRGSLHIVTES